MRQHFVANAPGRCCLALSTARIRRACLVCCPKLAHRRIARWTRAHGRGKKYGWLLKAPQVRPQEELLSFTFQLGLWQATWGKFDSLRSRTPVACYSLAQSTVSALENSARPSSELVVRRVSACRSRAYATGQKYGEPLEGFSSATARRVAFLHLHLHLGL